LTGGDGDEVDALWSHCIEHRGDDASRGVLADMLQANGDARGELFTLQLLPSDVDSAPARRARIRELVHEYEHAWLGPLREIASGASFERGMVKRLELVAMQPLAIADDRELWSVEEVVFDRASSGTFYRLLDSPAARSICRVATGNAEVIDAIATCRQPITHLACTESFAPGRTHAVGRFMQVVAKRDSITSIGVWLDGVDELMRRDWFDRIEHLTVACGMRRGLELWRRLPARTSLTIATSPGLDTCARTFQSDCQLELRRDGTARVSGEWMLQSLALLDELPSDFTRLELEDTSEPIIERIRAAVGGTREIALRGLVGRAGNLRWR
jgi:hypothetical protein